MTQSAVRPMATAPYRLPMMVAAPSGSIAFPEFTPEIAENDDRLRAISEQLHRTIK